LASVDAVGGFRIAGDGELTGGLPVKITGNGAAYVDSAAQDYTGAVGISVDNTTRTIAIDPANVETWTLTLRDVDGTTSTVTKKIVVVPS